MQGAALKTFGNDHLAISLAEMETPTKNTVHKINADLNEDLLGSNKFSKGKKEYVGVNTFRRLLNEAFDNKWSWEILSTQLMPNYEDPEYTMVIGRLYLPGLGFRDGIGTAGMDKKDNSAGFAISASNAFKNALKQSGFGASLLDEDWDEELFEENFDDEEEEEVEEKPKKKAAPAPKKKAPEPEEDEDDDDDEEEETPAPKKAKKDGPSEEQKEAMAEIRDIYNIDNNKQLLGFMQIWKKDLKSLAEVTPAELDKFLAYYDENEDEFEDFDPEEVA